MASEGADYRDTILTPETAFPMKADLGRREPTFLARWAEHDVYRAALRAREGGPRFVFHDGPPYANGDIHYGHILNKTLKDFVVKWQLVAGRHCGFRPGWDCHGLPIELNVERALGPKRASLTPLELRAACRKEAERWIDRQREQFKRLGVFGDWVEPYLTMSPDYEAAIIRALGAFVRQGLVYKGKKPVYWSWGARSALAEAEVEYADRDDPSVYVRFPIAEGSRATVASLFGLPSETSRPISALVWTTTPWTLPANLAIAVHPELEYALVEPAGREEAWLVAVPLVESVLRACRVEGKPSERVVRGAALAGVVARHPFIDRDSPLLLADHVTADAGTGLVHTAPGHGQDDFVLGQKHGLPAYAPVDDDGRFTDEVPEWKGTNVFEANPKIVAFLHESGALASPPDLVVHHSYPHCWRTKKPVVFRATAQWFVALDHPFAEGPLAGRTLREAALAEIDAIADGRHLRDDDERALLGSGWIPSWGKERIRGMIEARPDWCISRQRSWGVPIPAFKCASCGDSTMTPESVEHVAKLFEREGADAWFARDARELSPEGFRCAKCSGTELSKESDIIDVWFESGSSFLGTGFDVRHGVPPVDLYLEGSDQHRGWFHSSLLVGVTAIGAAPYKRVLTHGFVGDENGRPYSKSEINRRRAAGEKVDYIDPEKLIADQGAELLRLWAAYEDYRGDLRYSRDHLAQVGEAYRKIRNTIRFALGNLRDYDPAYAPDPDELVPIDRWALARLRTYLERVWKGYEGYDFRDVYHATIDVCTNDWSAFYLDLLKDRLYCAGRESPERRSAQHVLYAVARATTLAIAPILCFTAEDVWEHLPRRAGDGPSVFSATCPRASDIREDKQLVQQGAALLALRDTVNAAIEPKVKSKELAHRREATVLVDAPPTTIESLGPLALDLCESLAVADVLLRPGAEGTPTTVRIDRSPHPRCPRCWRHRVPATGSDGPCDRCARVLAERSAS
ncbi:MAG: isoleucine--tRNA ligase [Deltaproteobacteria bacterium]|nr:isoleucine--tRNA ligase [Deltaproteobacteria bacterium]